MILTNNEAIVAHIDYLSREVHSMRMTVLYMITAMLAIAVSLIFLAKALKHLTGAVHVLIQLHKRDNDHKDN